MKANGTADTGRSVTNTIYKMIAVFGMVTLFFIVASSGEDSYFRSGDESGYFANLPLIDTYGISTAFLRHFSGMAGPLHPILHWILSPLTGGVPPGVRFVNYVILLLILWLFRQDLWYRIVCIPMTIICAGYAMTEFPSILCMLVSILLLKRKNISVLQFFLAGLFFSLSIAGRWNYLVLMPVFFIYVGYEIANSRKALVAFIAASLIFPVWIGYAWQGISPPEVNGLAGYGFFDVKWTNFILCACFTAMMVVLLSPRWFAVIDWKQKNLKMIFFALVAGNLLFNGFEFLPAKSVFNRIPSLTFLHMEQDTILHLISLGFGTMAIVVSLIFLYALFLQIKRNNGASYLFYGIAIVLILLSTIKITHTFSSRYAYQVLPFLLLMISNENRAKVARWELILAIAGLGWGILSWISYQHIYL